MRPIVGLFFLYFIVHATVVAQSKSDGPVIKGFGKVYPVTDMDFKVDSTAVYKAVFDVMHSPDDPKKLTPQIETAARFLNMHAQNGVPNDQLFVALVVHNKASKDLLNNDTYQKRYGVPNPNSELLTMLAAAGADIVFCGQSSQARNMPKSKLLPAVQLALSAMTALIHYQNNNYSLIKF